MLMGQVVGTVVATRKEPELEGITLLLVRGVDLDGKMTSTTVVCADAVGAGVGELVLYAAGSSARQTEVTRNKPVDHVVMAIIDEISVQGKSRYKKSESAGA